MKPKFIITGMARHGKDETCRIFQQLGGFRFRSSSEIANELVVYSKLKDKYAYSSLEECFNDRINHRKDWFDLIVEFNQPLHKLGSLIFEKNDIYCGLRNREELLAIRQHVNIAATIWIDASERVETLEDSSSITVTPEDCDLIIYNNGTIKELEASIINLLF